MQEFESRVMALVRSITLTRDEYINILVNEGWPRMWCEWVL